MTDLPRLIGYRVVDMTANTPAAGTTDILSEADAIRDLLTRRRESSASSWVMVAVLEGDPAADTPAPVPYQVEKSVPVKIKRARSKYPWSEMKVGDSFFIPQAEYQPSISSTFSAWAKKRLPEAKITTRRVEGGYRVWRIK